MGRGQPRGPGLGQNRTAVSLRSQKAEKVSRDGVAQIQGLAGVGPVRDRWPCQFMLIVKTLKWNERR